MCVMGGGGTFYSGFLSRMMISVCDVKREKMQKFLLCGMLQGSLFSPLLFNIYMKSLEAINIINMLMMCIVHYSS